MGALLAAIGIVFVAELGDKTQLVALGLGARHRLGPVLAGVALGYAATNLLSVVIGGLLGAALPTRALAIGGGILFLGFAIWTALAHDHDHDDSGSISGAARSWPRVVASVAGAMFVAELGDKTMLATATLASQDSPLLVWIGATIGITASGAVGVFVGRSMGARLPEKATRFASAGLFAVFGIVLLATNL